MSKHVAILKVSHYFLRWRQFISIIINLAQRENKRNDPKPN